MQDENDVAAWATRPFCNAASHDFKVISLFSMDFFIKLGIEILESGDCFSSEVGTMEVYRKASIPRKSKSCTLVEEMYKNKACTHPANAFALHYEFDMNVTIVDLKNALIFQKENSPFFLI